MSVLSPGIEPGSPASQANILSIKLREQFTQNNTEYTSYQNFFAIIITMAKKEIDDKIISVSVWRHLVSLWSIVIYSVILIDYYTHNGLPEFLGPVSAVYIAILAVYTAQKEFERWHDYNIGRHPGEVYVFAWTILIVVLLVLEFTHRDLYKLPDIVFTTYIVVLGILAITKKSKENYLNKNRKRK